LSVSGFSIFEALLISRASAGFAAKI